MITERIVHPSHLTCPKCGSKFIRHRSMADDNGTLYNMWLQCANCYYQTKKHSLSWELESDWNNG